jgi:hypothetical protein
MDAPFEEGCGFKFGFLTKQSAAWALFGRNIGSSFSPLEQVQDSDSCFVVRVRGRGVVLRWSCGCCSQASVRAACGPADTTLS